MRRCHGRHIGRIHYGEATAPGAKDHTKPTGLIPPHAVTHYNGAFNFIMHQGIYTTSNPKILDSLKFQHGICGSALVSVLGCEKL